jgi:hypothetical protein
MTEQELDLDTLRNRPHTVTDPTEQFTALYLLHVRVAAGLERHEEGAEQIGKTIGQAWEDAAGYIRKLIDIDADAAFRLGVDLVMLPKSTNPENESIFGWMRGDGPIILGHDALRTKLADYLKTEPHGSRISKTLVEFMSYPLAGKTAEVAFRTPECFLTIASYWLGTRLRESKTIYAQWLFGSVQQKLQDPNIARVVHYYDQLEDTKWIVDDLRPFLTTE